MACDDMLGVTVGWDAREVIITARRRVRCTVADLVALVMDPHRYAEVDRKLADIRWVTTTPTTTTFAFRSRVAGLPGPRVVSVMTRTSPGRVEVRLAPSPANRLTRLLADVEASFEATSAPDDRSSIVFVRTLRYRFTRVTAWAARLVQRRLVADVADEVDRVRARWEHPTRRVVRGCPGSADPRAHRP